MDVVEPAVVVSDQKVQAAAGKAGPSAVSLKHRLEYLGLLAASRLAGTLPVSWVTGIGATMASLIGPRLRQNRRALENLAIAFPEKSAAEHQAIARAMWANMGRVFAESLIFDRILAAPGTIEIVEHEKWAQIVSEAGPSISCTLHMGSWELAIWPALLFGRKPAGVYKPLDNPLINRWLIETRTPLFPSGLIGKGENENDPKEGQRMVRRMIDVVRRGGSIGFVADHFDRRGEPIAFMGRRARFTTAPAMIARHVGARFWVGRCLRIGKDSRFLIEIRELELPQTGDRSADATQLTARMFEIFEVWIREHPEQWMWWNTRWVKADGTTAGKADRQ